RLADNIVARQPELSLGDPIDQHVSAIAHVLYGDLGRNVIDNLPQEAVVAITLLLDMPPLGDVFDRRHPPAMRQGLVDDVKRTSVRGFHDGMGYFSLCDVLQDVRAKFLDITLKRTGFLTVPDDVEEMAARLDDVRRQTAHVDIALVADYHARRLVIQHQTLGHVVEGSVEALSLIYARSSRRHGDSEPATFHRDGTWKSRRRLRARPMQRSFENSPNRSAAPSLRGKPHRAHSADARSPWSAYP